MDTPLSATGREGGDMFKSFKEFAFKGSVIDLAVGLMIGAAFGAIVTSFVNNLINPLVGAIVGKTDLANMFIAIPPGDFRTAAGAQSSGSIVFTYGAFLNSVVNFLVVALVLFAIVSAVNRFRKKEEELIDKECPYCLTQVPCKATRCPACTSELEDGSSLAAS
jgi:large conductance mechanosensitive channel